MTVSNCLSLSGFPLQLNIVQKKEELERLLVEDSEEELRKHRGEPKEIRLCSHFVLQGGLLYCTVLYYTLCIDILVFVIIAA